MFNAQENLKKMFPGLGTGVLSPVKSAIAPALVARAFSCPSRPCQQCVRELAQDRERAIWRERERGKRERETETVRVCFRV